MRRVRAYWRERQVNGKTAMSRHAVGAVAAVLAGVGCTHSLGPDESSDAGCRAAMECKGTPFPVPGVPALSQLSAGSLHTCGLTEDGAAWCWGATGGTGAPGAGNPAAPVPGGHQFVQIGAGRYHNCALTAEGTAYCWSSDLASALLCGPTECGETPVAVGTYTFRALAVGQQHTCALDLSGAAFCWGFNWMGETGSTRYGQTEREPVLVPDGLEFAEISANHGYTCALTLEGAPYCWGWAEAGQLGRATLPTCVTGTESNAYCSARPLAVATTQRFVGLSAGFTHACALTDQQRAMCWGDNGQGQLGDEVFGIRFTPGFTTDRRWSLIEAGGPTTCGTAAGEGTYCWGRNQSGLLGTGTTTDVSTTPQQVADGHTFTVLSAGPTHTCGLTAAGLAYCWGDNAVRQLGGG
jgi:alpha-tubulin suppressor-like RCC1 family protein